MALKLQVFNLAPLSRTVGTIALTETMDQLTDMGIATATCAQQAMNAYAVLVTDSLILAREVLTLISNREDDSICQSLIHEIQRLNKLYPR